MAQILGVDISHWQGNIDFEKLKENNVRFAIFKAGEVPTSNQLEFTDEKYGRNISEAARVGIISGAYYFFHPAIGASRQARHFDAVMDKYGMPDLPPVIDVEVNDNREPAVVASVLKAMIDALVSRGYRMPIIYSRWGFLVNQAGEPFWLKSHLLWLAQYNSQLVNKPADMTNVVMWQYTDKLRLPGVGVDLDGNYWLKTEAKLLALVREKETVEVEAPAEEEEAAVPEVVEAEEEQPVAEMDEVEDEDDEILIIPTQPVIESTDENGQEEQAEAEQETPETPAPSTDTEPVEAAEEQMPAVQPPAGAGASIWEFIVKLIQALLDSWQKK